MMHMSINTKMKRARVWLADFVLFIFATSSLSSTTLAIVLVAALQQPTCWGIIVKKSILHAANKTG